MFSTVTRIFSTFPAAEEFGASPERRPLTAQEIDLIAGGWGSSSAYASATAMGTSTYTLVTTTTYANNFGSGSLAYGIATAIAIGCAKSSKVHSRFHPRCAVVFIEGAHSFS